MSGKRSRVESEELDSPQAAKEGKMSASPMAVDPPKAIDEDLHRRVTARRRGAPGVATRQAGSRCCVLTPSRPAAAASWPCTGAKACVAWRAHACWWWA